MNTPKTRLALLGIAFGILLALLLVPQTRWLVRLSFIALSVLPGREGPQRQRIVEAHANDFQVQLAGRTESDTRTPLEYDRALVLRFPNSASLRAAILREATTEEVRLHRDEDNLLQGTPISSFQPGPNNPASTSVQLAAFDADAAAGERLDPSNAYFPFMRSVGLFASHKDTEGIAAIERASTKPKWHEYFEDPVEGAWRISDAIYGGREVVSATAVSAALLFPHYEQLRHAARVMVYKAVLDEQTGHFESGLVKRLALARCGKLMQVQATTIIGSLVGSAINATARSRPGGIPASSLDKHLTGEQSVQIRLDTYCAYVEKIGHPEAASQARTDVQTQRQIHRITANLDTVFGSTFSSLTRTAIAFFTCLLLLPNIMAAFVFGLLAAAPSRLPQLQERKPLPVGAATGFWGVILLGLFLAAIFVVAGPAHFGLYVMLAAAVPLAVVSTLALAVPRLRPRLWVGLTAAAITLGMVVVFGFLSSWRAPVLAWLAFGFLLSALLTLILSIVSRVKRVPVSVGLINGFRTVMPPLVCGLMLVYGGLVLWTVQQEARANYGLERSLHGEGQYLAQITGQEWPK